MAFVSLRTSTRRLLVAAALFVAGTTAASAADVTLMVEPSYTPERAAEVYKPLADYLSKATGHKVTLITPRNYHFFWRDMRQNSPVDLVFAEAHITDYRIKRFNAEPIARAAENTSFTLLASDQIENPTLNSLVGKSIVTMPSPSLGFALLLELYPNPVSQPNILSSAASWRDGVEIVFAGEADAAIVPTWLKDQYPNLIPIQTSREFPGAAVTASSTLDPKIKDDVKNALIKLSEDPGVFDVLTELGISGFKEATASEYDGAEAMLKGFYGYQ